MYMSLFCTVFKILSLVFLNLKTSRDSEVHIPYGDNLACLPAVSQHTKFVGLMPNFIDFKDMIGDPKFKIWVTFI